METTNEQPRTLESGLAALLTACTALAAALALLGIVLVLAGHRGGPTEFGVFKGQPAPLTSPSGILLGALRGGNEGGVDRAHFVLQAAVLLLILTPAIRVLFTLLSFALRRDVLYIMVTLIVLATLLHGVFGGA